MKWHPEEEGKDGQGQDRDDLVDGLDKAFFKALQQLLDWDSQGMFTEVVVGSKNLFEEDGGSVLWSDGKSGRLRSVEKRYQARRLLVAAGDVDAKADSEAIEHMMPVDSSLDVINPRAVSSVTVLQLLHSLTAPNFARGETHRQREDKSGRQLRLAVWDSFTLGVWTTASGSLGEVSAALELIMTNQSLLLE